MSGIVLLASYPKSGNTWLRAVLTSLWAGGSDVDIDKISVPNCADRALLSRYLGINIADLTLAEINALRPRLHDYSTCVARRRQFLKIHDAWLPSIPGETFPMPEERVDAVLYVVRDPRDVASSFARHLGLSPGETIGVMNQPRFRLGFNPMGGLWRQIPQLLSTWSVHVTSWLDGFKGRVFVVRYEDMLADPVRAFGAAVRFIGLQPSDDVLQRAIDAAGFERLRAKESAGGFVERPPVSSTFFRSGKAQGWRHELDPADAARIVQDHGVVMRRLRYSLDDNEEARVQPAA